jgi:hypothetical protein
MNLPARLAILAIVLGSVCEAAAQPPVERYQYLIHATNRLMDLSAKGILEDRGTLVEATRQACNALQLLTTDEQFKRDVRAWAENQFHAERNAFKRDFSLFINSFLLPERDVLRRAGLSTDAIDQILWSAAYFRDSVDARLAPETIFASLDLLRENICRGYLRLYEMQERDEVRKRAATHLVEQLGRRRVLSPRAPRAYSAVAPRRRSRRRRCPAA